MSESDDHDPAGASAADGGAADSEGGAGEERAGERSADAGDAGSAGEERAEQTGADAGDGGSGFQGAAVAGRGGAAVDGPGGPHAATASASEPADPRELLGEIRAIRRKARLARHAYWFPLVLFGLLTCASVPFYIGGFPAGAGAFARPLVRVGFLPDEYVGGGLGGFHGEGSAYYWLGAMLLGITATVLWYRWHGNRIGLRTPARGYLITALALLALALLTPVVSGRSITMPLIWPGGFVIRDLFPLVLIGVGLCVLAWAERSAGLTVIAVGYLALAIVVNLYILNNILSRLHWTIGTAAAALPNVVLPALVLLLAGAGAWVVQRRQRPPAEEG